MPTGPVANPILRGFNPDPSICRVGDAFYIATSTFEWFPGVQIWESRELQIWSLRTRALSESRLLDMSGIQSSGGVWAPCLSRHEGLFYLAYTVVRNWRGENGRDTGTFKDTPNFIATAENIDGPWSDPVFVNSSGFDPSLFHDADGRSWFLNMEWDYRGDPTHFTGILLQEYDRDHRCLTGPITKIFTGSPLDLVEGPHLYRREGWYYLVTAEGGTSYGHGVTVARSRDIRGPYEIHPANPVLTSLEDRESDLQRIRSLREGSQQEPPRGFYDRPQKAGHASLCRVTDDEWVLAHLSGRPYPGSAACPLGRETSLQRLRWMDGWPRVVDKDDRVVRHPLARTRIPRISEKSPNDPPAKITPPAMVHRNTDTEISDDFTGPGLHPAFRFLRRDPGPDISLEPERGCLRLFGRESPVSTFAQTVAAVSVGSFSYFAETDVDFTPDSFQQMAGLVVRYDERNQYYLRIAGDGKGKRILGILRFIGGRFDRPMDAEIPLVDGHATLALEVTGATGRFSWGQNGKKEAIPVELDMLSLSDEGVWPEGFTGTFVGMACHDMTGRRRHADFRRFVYRER